MTKHTINRLTDKQAKAAVAKNCRLGDGGGLYLNSKPPRSCAWEYQFDLGGKRHLMGLGSVSEVSLSRARELRTDAAAQVRDGVNPIAARKAGRQTAAAALTVMQSIESYIAAMEGDWQTERYPDQIRERMNTYVKPIIGDMPISDVGPADARLVLAPIWKKIRPTAKRIRQHLEAVVDSAIAGGHRKNEINPFEKKKLRGSLSFAKQKTKHFASLPFDQAPAFLAELRAQDGVKARALEFVMLTAVRVGDVVGAGKRHSVPMLWSHVNLAEKIWRIPSTKTGVEHVVPLSDAALAVLAQMRRYRDPANGDVVFPGSKKGTVISDATLRYLIHGMGYKDRMTTHGCRSLFKSWAEEVGSFDTLVIEAALAHAKKGMAAPYHRGSYLGKRRRLMDGWSEFLEGRTVTHSAAVVAFR